MIKILNKNVFLTWMLIVWIISDVIAATGRLFSNQFDSYMGSKLEHFENPMAGFVGLIPPISSFSTVIISGLILLFYTLTIYLIENKGVPLVLKYTPIIIWVLGIAFGINNIFNNTLSMLEWKFYLSLIPNVALLTILVIIAGRVFSAFKLSLK